MPKSLIFPIEFDLQKAVEKVGQDWEKTYTKKLEDYSHIKETTLYPCSGCLIIPIVAMRYLFPINASWCSSILYRILYKGMGVFKDNCHSIIYPNKFRVIELSTLVRI